MEAVENKDKIIEYFKSNRIENLSFKDLLNVTESDLDTLTPEERLVKNLGYRLTFDKDILKLRFNYTIENVYLYKGKLFIKTENVKNELQYNYIVNIKMGQFEIDQKDLTHKGFTLAGIQVLAEELRRYYKSRVDVTQKINILVNKEVVLEV